MLLLSCSIPLDLAGVDLQGLDSMILGSESMESMATGRRIIHGIQLEWGKMGNLDGEMLGWDILYHPEMGYV